MSSLPNQTTDRRQFYHDAFARSFRYSARLASQTGRRAEEVVDTPEFNALLSEAGASSLDLARRAGDMAVVYLSAAVAPWPWWKELLAYERAYFLQAASTDQRLVTYFPRRGVAATSVHFTWDIPLLFERIQACAADPVLNEAAEQRVGAGEPRGFFADVPRRDVTLLFSRASDGKIYVIELERPVAAVFRFTNGMRKKEQIAAAAGMPLAEVEEILHSLAAIGAVENV